MKNISPMYRSAASLPPWRQARRLANVVLLLTVLVTGCQSVAPVVKIGLVAPFEGRYRDTGYDVLYSARLAVREINAAGGIGGTRVALVALDDGGNLEYAQATASSLLIDPGVVAVVGHWLPDTTESAGALYDQNGLAFVAGGKEPFAESDPARLSPEFVAAYEAVTPFDEAPGPYAQSAYDAFQLLFRSFAVAQEMTGQIDRPSVRAALAAIEAGEAR
jgi:ABC-type branched-subunit amino acid transport system substrate-binding protein